jgi:hypothetical protein
MLLVSSHIMVVRRRQWMPFWLPLSTAGERLFLILERQYNFFFSFSLLILIKPINDGLVQPLPHRLPGGGMLDRQNHAAGGANGSIMVGMFVCLCLTSKKPSEREFFVPAGTDLGVKLLRERFSTLTLPCLNCSVGFPSEYHSLEIREKYYETVSSCPWCKGLVRIPINE